MQNKKIPTDQQTEEIINAREQDILIRGKDCPVYDYNGKIVELLAYYSEYADLKESAALQAAQE